MTELELREHLSTLDSMARETIEKALSQANGDTNEHVKARILRALSDEYLPPYHPTDVVYALDEHKGILTIRVRLGAVLPHIGKLKRTFLEKKKVKGKWFISGKPTHPDTGFKVYVFKKEKPKKKRAKSSSPGHKLEASFQSMTREEQRETLIKLMKKVHDR